MANFTSFPKRVSSRLFKAKYYIKGYITLSQLVLVSSYSGSIFPLIAFKVHFLGPTSQYEELGPTTLCIHSLSIFRAYINLRAHLSTEYSSKLRTLYSRFVYGLFAKRILLLFTTNSKFTHLLLIV